MALRQAFQETDVAQDKRRLINGPQKVFAFRQIDAGLTADRRIHLRRQRRWDLNIGNAAPINRGRKARQISDHSSAKRQERHGSMAASESSNFFNKFKINPS